MHDVGLQLDYIFFFFLKFPDDFAYFFSHPIYGGLRSNNPRIPGIRKQQLAADEQTAAGRVASHIIIIMVLAIGYLLPVLYSCTTLHPAGWLGMMIMQNQSTAHGTGIYCYTPYTNTVSMDIVDTRLMVGIYDDDDKTSVSPIL